MGKRTKLLATLVAGVLLSTSLVGCGPSDKKDGEESKELLIYVNSNQDETDAFKKIADKWGKDNGYEVTVKLNDNKDDFSKLKPILKSKNCPDIILGIPHDNLGNYVQAGLVSELSSSDVDTSDIRADQLMDAVKIDGKQYAVPLGQETVALFYNKDKVKEAPTTMEDVVKLAKEGVGFNYNLTQVYANAGFIQAGDGYFFGKDDNGNYDPTKLGFDTEAAKNAYKFIKQLSDDKVINMESTDDVALSDFTSEKTGFFISGPWNVGAVKEKLGDKVGVVALPSLNGKTAHPFLGVQMGCVVKNSSKQDAAKKFLNDTYAELCEAEVTAGNRLPVINSVEANGDLFNAFTEATNDAVLTPNIPEVAAIWNSCGNNIKLYVKGEESLDDCAKNTMSETATEVSQIQSKK